MEPPANEMGLVKGFVVSTQKGVVSSNMSNRRHLKNLSIELGGKTLVHLIWMAFVCFH